jgi:hypothetical protein
MMKAAHGGDHVSWMQPYVFKASTIEPAQIAAAGFGGEQRA